MVKKLDITATHIIFISDIHLGIKQNSEEWQENQRNYFYNFFIPQIKAIKSKLKPNEKLVCFDLGDTFNDRKAIDIDVNNLAIDIFEDISKEIEIYALNGNHDLSKRTNEGTTSLRSFKWIPNVTLITAPTLVKVNIGSSEVSIIAIPYLGNIEKENMLLVKHSSIADYALLHTELSKMKMDNGMTITAGVNADAFKGKIFSGHIHRRQEMGNAIYVGSPYHTTRGDIGDQKGLYLLNLQTKALSFIPNNYSPIYQNIPIEKFMSMNTVERQQTLDNNYTAIIMNESDLPKIKKNYDIYNLGIGTNAKIVKPVINKQHQEISVEDGKEYQDLSLIELIKDSISQLELDDEAKDRLSSMSVTYLNNAESEIADD